VVRALERKLLRDLWHLRGQLGAISLVVACGVAMVVTTRVGYESLVASQSAYYASYRFADVFASLKRAPEVLVARLEAIPGVAAVQTRVVSDVTLDVPGLAEPATGRLVSLPERGRPRLNGVHLRRGRWIEPERRDEVIASEAFAQANRLEPGDSIGAVLNGRWERLRIVGIGLSPEYIYEIRGTDLFPDNKRFGVIWMNREALGPAFGLEDAFNDVALGLEPRASEPDVIGHVDRLLERYGGRGAHGRADQISHRFISDEIRQNRVSGTVVPAIFLSVAAFLLHVVLSRLVATQREQIAVLRAFGYSSARVAGHYLGFALFCAACGSAVGACLGLWWAAQINEMYGQFYRFPFLSYAPSPGALALAIAVSSGAALLGAAAAVRRVLRLPPAEAMRPEPPARFRAGVLERTGLVAHLPTGLRLIWRNLARRPGRAVASTLGIASAVGILVVGYFFVDAVGYLAEVQFRNVQREDLTVSFHEPRSARARFALNNLPGVMRAEPFRVVPVRLRREHVTRRVALFGLEPRGELRRVLDAELREVKLPSDGLVLTRMLAEILRVGPGDTLGVEVLEEARPVRTVRVMALADELMGTSAYMDRRALARLLREEPRVSGAFVKADALQADALHALLKRLPAVAGSGSRLAALRSFDETLARSLGVFIAVLIGFASVIAAATIYNAARIALSERGRELASLRVLGFTRRELDVLLLGEQALLTALALPVGFVLGYRMCALLSRAYQWELFRLPLVVTGRTYGFALGVVLASALVSGWIVRRRLHRLDLVAVLKTRE
jgi:putative ABC transport system permease protein